jgi:hypothetical protein
MPRLLVLLLHFQCQRYHHCSKLVAKAVEAVILAVCKAQGAGRV